MNCAIRAGRTFFYAWVWSELAYEHDMPVHSVSLVDESGCAVLDVGEDGFSGSSCETLNPEAEFDSFGGDHSSCGSSCGGCSSCMSD